MVGSSSHFSYDHLLRNPSLIKENSGSPEYGTLKRFQGDNLLAFSAKSYPGGSWQFRSRSKGTPIFFLACFDISLAQFFLKLIFFFLGFSQIATQPMEKQASESWYDTGAISASLFCCRLAWSGMCETLFITRQPCWLW